MGLSTQLYVTVLALGLSLANPATDQCDPGDYEPSVSPGVGCTWWYITGAFSERIVILSATDTRMTEPWTNLPPCACGWYPYTVPCPRCEANCTTVTLTDTLQWSVSLSTGSTIQSGLSLKNELIGEVGWNGALTASEERSLSGTRTVSVQEEFCRQPIMCFTRYYRQTWWKRSRTGRLNRDWIYFWQANSAGGVPCGANAFTECTEIGATGSVKWSTRPNYEWAPQEPPCGGVPVQNPDPWDGKRETPCCSTVCEPPPLGTYPCCGCEFAP